MPDEITRKLETEFRANDRNGDGYLTRDEIEGRMPVLQREFDRVDTNRDGRISREEMLAVRRMMPGGNTSQQGRFNKGGRSLDK